MERNVVSEEYINLQKGIMDEQVNIKDMINKKLVYELDKGSLNLESPVLPQMKISPVPVPLFRHAVESISHVVIKHNPDITEEFITKVRGLGDETVLNWIKGTITFDMVYFQNFSRENKIMDPSVPHFLAEQSLRPFMQVLGERCASFINDIDVMGICPCCGETLRLAILQNDGEKYLFCPRCESMWLQKKMECVHCGDDDYENLFYVTVEEDTTSKLEVCKTCRNYLKLVVEAEMTGEKQAALLDLETIHLDFVAEQEGYGENR
ncbi:MULTISPECIES: formate dehydrogenase accessory protein FdhE [Bacillaceae]|uniref:Formate dehydrogenase accessory protein FdhE n=1 Tax=Evansella alkalicola TaxID=745819 RepID=A0ABS6JV66_9BACI|nr:MULTISPECIES: formate dehydrogenase accessory protein FdhE [Bacillaceae]MBU9721035.1 formate dehydrogenase accessory protein FdhE [Bacillus alkalicola]